jgi:hypothetical protein
MKYNILQFSRDPDFLSGLENLHKFFNFNLHDFHFFIPGKIPEVKN